ncbi:type I polyketide synthase, partial [Streptomyces sp. NPDC052701]|uniref:type I polyketide synthase n=1 Tax=Streptomyces sp. NPDC052701 TaxID=3155533 RepID=UPI00344242AF
GAEVDWDGFYAGRNVTRVDLPTYAFQRKRYWVDAQVGGNVASAGLDTVEHPLLGAAITLADSDGIVMTGRLSPHTQPWLADHVIGETILFPGTGFVELALHAAHQTGCAHLEELTLQAPLILPPEGAAQIQVAVGGPGPDGKRTVTIHSRTEGQGPDVSAPWLLHAQGTVGPAAPSAPVTEPAAWPPTGAEPLAVDRAYDTLLGQGYAYGPVFQGLKAAWRRGDDVFAEVELPSEAGDAAGGFGLHPALLDSALHAALLAGGADGPEGSGDGRLLPFAWSGVELYATGGSALRVRLSPAGKNAVSLKLTDPSGQPVAEVRSLLSRPVTDEQLGGRSAAHDSLFRLDWVPVPLPVPSPAATTALSAGRWADVVHVAGDGTLPEVPDIVVLRCDTAVAADAEGIGGATRKVLGALQAWTDDERFTSSSATLAVVTRGAVAVDGEDVTDLAGAAVWGLVRSAQLAHPGRVVLVDLDERTAADGAAVPVTLLAEILASGEPQVVVRGAALRAARLVRVPAGEDSVPATRFDAEGPVLVTGAGGMLGRLFSRHLVSRYGVRELLLTSRRGPAAPELAELADELRALGAEVEVAACDMADRAAVTALLQGRRLSAVVHLAGVLDDAALASLTPERMDTVLRPKAYAALNLHELTAHMDLSAFVTFSSAAGTLGNAGQGNYAASNALLDGLAQHRRAHGLAGQSLAWGLWEGDSGMAGELAEADRLRMSRVGIGALTPEQGLALFDAALGLGTPALVPIALDTAVLARAGEDLPQVYRGLVRGVVRRTAAAGTAGAPAALRTRLASLPPQERTAVLLDAVCGQAASVLGHETGGEVEPDRAFKDLGFDSLTAVEFRNRVNAATGLRLPATLVFDYPNARVLAERLHEELFPAGTGEDPAVEEQVRRVLQAIPFSRLRESGLMQALLDLGGEQGGLPADPAVQEHGEDTAEAIDGMDTESLITMALDGLVADDHV